MNEPCFMTMDPNGTDLLGQDGIAQQLKVRLHPFLHQVSGSTLMLEFNERIICKPLLQAEYQFYHSLPEGMENFTAGFKGCVDITSEELNDGACYFYAVVSFGLLRELGLHRTPSSTEQTGQHEVVDFLPNCHGLGVNNNGSTEIEMDRIEIYGDPASKLEMNTRLNKRLRRQLDECGTRFILLENLTFGMEQPSILDLKMGTRTHGEDDPPYKIKEKVEKAASSTTGKLGVRLHGMQKFSVRTQKYETLDKFDGLKLSVRQFVDTLRAFLHNGEELNVDVLHSIIQELKLFHDCVSKQDAFRFYSSSLLIIYDGAATSGIPTARVKAIDFAHTQSLLTPSVGDTGSKSGPDNGYLQGIQNLINIFSDFVNDHEQSLHY